MGRWGGGMLLALLLIVSSASAQRPVWVLYDSKITSEATMRARLEATGARIRYSSRWLNAISVDAPADKLTQLQQLAGVVRTQNVARLYHRASGRSGASIRLQESFDSAFYGPNWPVIRQLGIPAAHTLGFTGRGIRIAILDTGFEPAHEALRDRIVSAQKDFINNDAIVANQPGDPTGALDQEEHGTRVWSLLAGRAPGRVVGPAFDATFILAKVKTVRANGEEDPAADEDRWVAAVEWADSQGARLISSSVAFRAFADKPDYRPEQLSGDSALSTRIADEAARRGILIVNMVGDEGPAPSSVMAPADADSIIAVGAIDRNGVVLPTSSRGPTADGRLKPELVAPATRLVAANSITPVSYGSELEGPDYATPLIAGMAAMFLQAWPSLTPMAARTALLLSASRSQSPDNNVGSGVPDIASAILFPEGLFARAITPGLSPGNLLTTLAPSFTWEAPLRHPLISALFRLEIATDANFANVVYADTTRDRTTLTLTRPLRPGTYFWRVVATAFPGIQRITPVAGPFVMPDWVRLTTLNSPTTTPTTPTPTFTWESLDAPPPVGPLTFEVQVLNAQTGRIVQTINAGTNTSVQPPTSLAPNITYSWRVIARTTPAVGMADTVASVGNFLVTTDEQPPATLLYQNFPNPFPRTDLALAETQIWFDVTTRTAIELAIYDLRGRLVRQLIPADPSCGQVFLEPGQYGRGNEGDTCVQTRWNGQAQNGEFVSRGVYVLRMRAGGIDQVKRILYMPQ
jgi:hypothetical protein